MRNRTRKLLSLLLAAALLLSPGFSALAETVPETVREAPAPEAVPEEAAEAAAEAPAAEDETPAEDETGSIEAEDAGAAVLDAAVLPAPDYLELYLADYGSDENDGSREAPLRTLARAAELANAAEEELVYLLLLTDLESRASARFYEKEIVLMSDGETCRVSRAADFAPAQDARRGLYRPALIECARTEGTELRAARLTIGNLILDDRGIAAGTLFRECLPGQDNSETVQDGIVAAYDGGASIVLGAGAELLNYGGLSAVYLSGDASLVMEDHSGIRDTLALPRLEGMAAVLLHDAAAVVRGDEAVVIERPLSAPAADEARDEDVPGTDAEALPEREEEPDAEASPEPEEEPDAGAGAEPETLREAEAPSEEAPEAETLPENGGEPENGDPAEEDEAHEGPAPLDAAASPLKETLAELIGLRFTGPASMALDESSESYPVPYRLSLRLSDAEKAMILALGVVLNESGGTVVFDFDSRLDLSGTPESLAFDSEIFTVESSELTDGALTLRLRLSDDWALALLQSEETVSLTLQTSLPRSELESGIGETMHSAAEVSLRLLGSSERLILSAPTLDAPTRLLGPVCAAVLYDLNGGEGEELREEVSAQDDYPLNTEDTPTHADVDGKPVLFIGWTLERDSRIYARNEGAPATVSSVDVAENSEITVYAVYGFDENGDGVPDADQRLLALCYDANGGEGAPDTQLKPADPLGFAHFDISPTEPTRPYHRFQGWAKDPAASEAQYRHDAPRAADRDLLIGEDTTLYAVWKENPRYTLSYNANGGTGAPPSQTGVSDERGVVQMTISTVRPTRQNYTFLGWGTSRSGSASYFPGEAVQISNGNVTLYAIWQRVSGGGSGYSGGGNGAADQSAPRTDDNSRPILYLSLALISLAAAAAVAWPLLRNKKRGKKR